MTQPIIVYVSPATSIYKSKLRELHREGNGILLQITS